MKPRTSVKLVTGPAAEPVTLAEAKAWAKIDTTEDDALLAVLITTAVQAAEEYTRRSFITQTHRLTLDSMGGINDWLPEGTYDLPVSSLSGGLPTSIDLPRPPLASVTSITTYSSAGTSAVYSSANYFVDADGARVNLYESASWPSDLRAQKACEVVYVAGYGATSSSVPSPIKTAILMHVQTMYDSRIVCEMPDACMSLLNRYKIYG